jgi:hypothetical protein
MNTEYNLENVIRIIDSEIVPENKKNGYNFNIGPIDVCVQKPYIDTEGINVGNSIYIEGFMGSYAIQFFIKITDDKKYLTTLYENKDMTSFQKLDATIDLEIHNYFQDVFKSILEEMELLEKNRYRHVIILTDYSKQFGTYQIPTELELLLQFQNDYREYAQWFFLRKEETSDFLSSWCDIEALQTEFCKQIYPFAVANSTGSTYAFWDNGIETNLNKMPILIFGDEGGLHLVAKNILTLLEQLTFDTEIIVYEEEIYFSDDKDDEDYMESLYADEFKVFVKQQFAIEPINDPNKLIEDAQNELQKSFDEWYAKYQSKDDDSKINLKTDEEILYDFNSISYENSKKLHFQFRDQIAVEEENDNIWKTGFWHNDFYYSFYKTENNNFQIHILWYKLGEEYHKISEFKPTANFEMIKYLISEDNKYELYYCEANDEEYSERKIENNETELVEKADTEWRKMFDVVQTKYMEMFIAKNMGI